jgi:tungstate transport system substrate-binding protein
MDRREWMGWTTGVLAGAFGAAMPVWAQGAAPLRLGVDGLIEDTGLAGRWKAAMARDLGLAAQWVRAPSGTILQQLESGELPIGLFLGHPLADRLDQQGLIHDRQTLARTPVLLVGPTTDPAGLRGERDVVHALHQILAGQAAGVCHWLPAAKESALAGLSETLMSTLGAQKLPTKPGAASDAANAAAPAYQLLTLADWQKMPRDARKPLKVLIDQDPRLWLSCQVARSFKTPHPAGKLLVKWLQGPLGRQAVSGAGSVWQKPKG